MKVHDLSRADARRIAVRAQLLDADRPTDMFEIVRHLTLLPLDPTTAIAPSADLVLWTRLGSSYLPADLERALEDRSLIELRGTIRPPEHLAAFGADMADWPGRGPLREWQEDCRDWVTANDACRRDILERLSVSGPLRSRDLPDTCKVPWKSSGWTNNRNVTQLLGFMVQRGEVAVAGRKGRDKLWDLAERVYPDDPVIPAHEAVGVRAVRRLHALGIARAGAPETLGEPNDVGEVGEAATVNGVKGSWRVDPSYLSQPFSGRAALLSPFDRLVQDRIRMAELFESDYQLEMYKPVASRKWGYFALPILYGDRLVGKFDATADRKSDALRVNAIYRDVDFTKAMVTNIRAEIVDLARWLQLDLTMPSGW